MLRITPLIAKEKAILRLEGKLGGAWANELAKVWSVWHNSGLKRIRVDLRAVNFVDERGKDVLIALHQEGAEFVASDPLISALLEDIAQSCQAKTTKVPGSSKEGNRGAS
jgi:anti-anti-sigma regulatory factor